MCRFWGRSGPKTAKMVKNDHFWSPAKNSMLQGVFGGYLSHFWPKMGQKWAKNGLKSAKMGHFCSIERPIFGEFHSSKCDFSQKWRNFAYFSRRGVWGLKYARGLRVAVASSFWPKMSLFLADCLYIDTFKKCRKIDFSRFFDQKSTHIK